ncbi:hypothetical protein BBJ28_00019482 [Nothophytophthora sp. Chile5]|nr:hypothetical protein BBJ28_00019482 [Nothophytophthora sp. Chile5]
MTMATAKASTVKALYKCLLRDARELQRTPHFNFRSALEIEQWGIGNYVEPASAKSHRQQLPNAHGATPRLLRSLAQFRELREQGFQHNAPKVDIVESVRAMTVTDGVRVEVTSQYVQNDTSPKPDTYRFTYRVTITNESTCRSLPATTCFSLYRPIPAALHGLYLYSGLDVLLPRSDKESSVQILGRQYTFESENGQRIALPRNSPGVVGNTPVLAPGQTFEYASGVDIDAPRGSVTGCLHALRRTKASGDDKDQDDDDGELFDAFVSKFALLMPQAYRRQG